MKVILTTNMKKLGKIGDVVVVRNGYGRNYLLPNNRAIAFSKENYSTFEEQKQKFLEADDQRLKEANEAVAIINKLHIHVIENAGEDGKLYGSVTPAVISNAINSIAKKQGATRDLVHKSNIKLDTPIKTTGVYKINLDLHSDVNVKKEIVVARSEAEVDSVIKAAKEEAKKAQEAKRKEEEALNSWEEANAQPQPTDKDADVSAEAPAEAKTDVASTTDVAPEPTPDPAN